MNLALAIDVPKFSFGSMQPVKDLVIHPGESVTTKLYFYNVYGDKNTHLKLNVEAPSGWDVIINPSLEVVEYDVSGEKKTFEENLVIEPSKILKSAPKNFSSDDFFEIVKSKEGYIKSNYVILTIKPPKNAKLGTNVLIKIKSVAFWLNNGGVSLEQERSFDYNIKILSKQFYEKKLTTKNNRSIKQDKIIPGLSKLTGNFINFKFNFFNIFGFVFIIIIVFIYFMFKKRQIDVGY